MVNGLQMHREVGSEKLMQWKRVIRGEERYMYFMRVCRTSHYPTFDDICGDKSFNFQLSSTDRPATGALIRRGVKVRNDCPTTSLPAPPSHLTA